MPHTRGRKIRQRPKALHWPQEETGSIDETTPFDAQPETQRNEIQVEVFSEDVWRV